MKGDIKLIAVDGTDFEKAEVGPASLFQVDHHHNAGIGYAEVKIHFEAGERGTLELIRAERQGESIPFDEVKPTPLKDVLAGKKPEVVIEDGDEGRGVKLLLRRYRFSEWGIEDGVLVFKNCVRT